MHYVDEGSGEPVLLLHGEPTWAFLYRKLIPPLVDASRASSRPTTSASAARTSRRAARTTPTTSTTARSSGSPTSSTCAETTVVVQDWGGPIGLRLAVERPERVARLVILNTGIGAGRAPSPEWLRFREFMRRVGDRPRARAARAASPA